MEPIPEKLPSASNASSSSPVQPAATAPGRTRIPESVKKQIVSMYPLASKVEKETLANRIFGPGGLAKMYNIASRLGATQPQDLTREQMDACVLHMPIAIQEMWKKFVADNAHNRLQRIVNAREHAQDAYSALIRAGNEAKADLGLDNVYYRQLVNAELVAELKQLESVGEKRARWISCWALAGEWDQFIEEIVQNPENVFTSMTRVVGKRNPLTRPVIRDLRLWAMAL